MLERLEKVFLNTIMTPVLKILYKNVRNKNLQILDTFRTGSFVSVEDPSEREIKDLTKTYKLDESLIRDALDPYEVPRIEHEEGRFYIFARYTHESNGKVSTSPLLIVLDEKSIFTISKNRCEPLEKLFKDTEFITTQKTKSLIQIFIQINNLFNSYVLSISKKIKNASSKIEYIDNKDIVLFVEFEKTLNDLISALIPLKIILERIQQDRVTKLYEEDTDLIEDLGLNNEQLIETIKAELKNIVNIREAYSTIMTNNLNKSMKFLTSITLILTIPTMISSFFGMNVNLPLSSNPLAYILILIASIFISLAILFIFFKNHLL